MSGIMPVVVPIVMSVVMPVVVSFDEGCSCVPMQSAALLPAVAALLRASPQEFKALKTSLADHKQGSWWHR